MMTTKKKSSAPSNSGGLVPMPSSPRESLRIEKIDNGYLAHHSGSDGKGRYHEKTVYHPTAPKITLVATPGKAPIKKK
jgi:hypothetical protein